MSSEARLCTYVAIPCWAVWIWAFVDMLLGNPTAINGVIGIGLPAVMLTAAAIALRSGDHPKAEVSPKPDYAKIERLERELGLIDHLKPTGVIRRIERDGEIVEIRSWGS